uniref:Uncharacterized protein n=1 Tax=Rhizophora mucronata TaxID=61149 RepID=A0A2P2P3X0_RHIMU
MTKRSLSSNHIVLACNYGLMQVWRVSTIFTLSAQWACT